jgi:hypothetical protein
MTKLQHVQNITARIVTKTLKYDHITPILREFHWLPVEYRVEYKIFTFTYKSLDDQSPAYIKDMIDVYIPARNLRSQINSVTLVVLKSRTVRYGDRWFQTAVAKLRNALPPGIKDCNTMPSFKRALKTHYFMKFYGR